MNDQRQAEGRQIEVEVSKLLATLQKHRAKHREIYYEAMESYRLVLSEWYSRAEELAAKARSALSQPNTSKSAVDSHRWEMLSLLQTRPVEPVSFLHEYDAILELLSWEKNELVTLSQEEFDMYVRDEWDWKTDFLINVGPYSEQARNRSTLEMRQLYSHRAKP